MCHVAGTDSKGNTSAILPSILQVLSLSLSVDRFSSPHLSSIQDYIIIDSKPVAVDANIQVWGEVEKPNQEFG